MDSNQLKAALEERWPARCKAEERCGAGPGRLIYEGIAACENERERAAWQAALMESGDLGDFLDRAHGCADLMFGCSWGALARELDWELPLSERAARTVMHGISDAGGVKIGDAAGTFSLVVPNGGAGDGFTAVVFADSDRDVNIHMMNWYNRVDGDIQVYPFDCAETAPADGGSIVLHGAFDVYSGVGTYSGGSVVAFVRCSR